MKTNKVILESVVLAIVSMFVNIILESNEIFFFLPANYQPDLIEAVAEGNIVGIIFLGIVVSIIAAFTEEFFFRFLPYKLWSGLFKAVPYWLAGLATAFLFALLHTNQKNGFEFPLIQFVFGLYLWSLIGYKKGYRLAVVSHMTFNMTIFISVAIFSFYSL